ncbi:MAG: hypothetical protein KUG77_04685 [Nannocystaceae bacterium]|nr:hypothetical protein [Nannocystaceae bacterium]
MRLNRPARRADAGTLPSTWIARGLLVALMTAPGLTACSVEPSAASPLSFTAHCGDEQGDQTCAALGVGKPFCDLCRPASADQGCAAAAPTVPACGVGGGLATTTFTAQGSGSTGEGTTTSDTLDTLDTLGTTETTASVDESSSSGGPMLPCASPDGTFDAGCARADSTRPYCSAQTCVSCVTAGGADFCGGGDPLSPACNADTGQCGACGDVETFSCGQELPVCNPTGECMPCAGHDECTSGACHLDPADSLVGECFLEDELIFVDSAAVCPGDGTEATPNCSLADALASLVEDDIRVLQVAAGTYDEGASLLVDATVAIVGNGGVPSLEGDGAGAPGLALMDGRVYTVGIRVSNNVAAEGVRCSNATLWMQGSEIGGNADYGVFTNGPCFMRLDASSVFNNLGGGIRLLGGSLVLENAAVGNNGDGARGPGINAQFAAVEILYSTVAGNDGAGPDSLQCLETEGSVRNSILVGASESSAALDCFPLQFTTNAIDTAGFAGGGGVNVEAAYNPLWFNDADGGDFRLGAPPLTPFGGVALWVEGDPAVDADGTDRPLDGSLGYAGADEPD